MSRKVLVPVDSTDPNKKINDFLFPEKTNETFHLKGIRKGKNWELGMVVLTSDISKEDLFKDIINNKHQVLDVQKLLHTLEQYLSTLQDFKIGNILKIDSTTTELAFNLVHKSSSGMKRAISGN